MWFPHPVQIQEQINPMGTSLTFIHPQLRNLSKVRQWYCHWFHVNFSKTRNKDGDFSFKGLD